MTVRSYAVGVYVEATVAEPSDDAGAERGARLAAAVKAALPEGADVLDVTVNRGESGRGKLVHETHEVGA